MKQTIRMGRFGGIPIGANWSVIVIVGLITAVLAAGVLPELAPDRPWPAYAVVGVAAAVLFFVSLVTHELAHSLVARRYGVGVRAITLWMFGGVSELEEEMSSPGEELRMAVAGPATSLGLGVAFLAASVLTTALSLPDLVVAALWWLGFVNIGLCVFNLLPAYPMDGGRVLRALLWSRSGDRIRATQTSARTGHWFAYGLIGVGVLLALGGGLVEGVWLMFIGWYLEGASRAEATAVVQQAVLGRLRADELMSPHPVTVPADVTVEHLVEAYVLGRHHSAFPVVDTGGALVGLVDLDRVRSVPQADRAHTEVGEIARPLAGVPIVGPGDPGSEVLARMSAERSTRALVVDAGHRLVGIITSTDLARVIDVGAAATGTGPGQGQTRPA
jgi:Zn-dependent protease/predicted transcriptional regulator